MKLENKGKERMRMRDKLEKALMNNDKPTATTLTMNALEQGFDIVTFYEEILAGILNDIDCAEDDFNCIWLEHQMTWITRGLIEMSYPYVLKKQTKLKKNKHALVVCPKDETHDLGALIGANLLTMHGFETTVLGANTPLKTIESALSNLHVDYLVISVSNAYHLFEVQKILLRLDTAFPEVVILGSGRGFTQNAHRFKSVRAIINSNDDIIAFIKKEGL